MTVIPSRKGRVNFSVVTGTNITNARGFPSRLIIALCRRIDTGLWEQPSPARDDGEEKKSCDGFFGCRFPVGHLSCSSSSSSSSSIGSTRGSSHAITQNPSVLPDYLFPGHGSHGIKDGCFGEACFCCFLLRVSRSTD